MKLAFLDNIHVSFLIQPDSSNFVQCFAFVVELNISKFY